jgi:hypothetical protein
MRIGDRFGKKEYQEAIADSLIDAQEIIDNTVLTGGQKTVVFAGTLNEAYRNTPYEDPKLIPSASLIEKNLTDNQTRLDPQTTRGLFGRGVKLAKKFGM